MNRRWMYYAGLVFVSIVWGANFGVSRLAMETFDPILFTTLRFGLSVPFFLFILWLTEGSIGLPLKVLARLAVIGLVGVTILEIAVMYSIKYTTLANASLLNVAPWPIFAALFAPLFTTERITRRLAVGGAIAAVGVTLVILGGGGIDLSVQHMVGNGLALFVSIIGALFNLACMPLMKTYSALRISTWYIVFGSLFMLPFTWGSWSKVEWTMLGAGEYTAIVYNVLICTVAAFVIWNASMYKVGAARANFFRYVVPAAAAVVGFAWFGEQIAWLQIAGALFMTGGLIWITRERGTSAG